MFVDVFVSLNTIVYYWETVHPLFVAIVISEEVVPGFPAIYIFLSGGVGVLFTALNIAFNALTSK